MSTFLLEDTREREKKAMTSKSVFTNSFHLDEIRSPHIFTERCYPLKYIDMGYVANWTCSEALDSILPKGYRLLFYIQLGTSCPCIHLNFVFSCYSVIKLSSNLVAPPDHIENDVSVITVGFYVDKSISAISLLAICQV